MGDVAVEVTDSERIDVGDGVSIPKAWEVTATGEANVVATIRMHVVFDEQLRRTVAASVGVDRAEEGAEVTAAALRDVRVQHLVTVSSMRLVEVTREQGKPEPLGEYLAKVKARSDRNYEETAREAVVLYRIASTVNLAPLRLISKQLGVSVSTATRMMARAREAGLAVDLITRETHNRLRTGSGPSIGR